MLSRTRAASSAALRGSCPRLLRGGFVTQAFIACWFTETYGTSPCWGPFFAVGLLQALSFQVAVRLAERVGLVNTMVFTHLPSNLLLALIPFAPTEIVAFALLFARYALSQMDVPTRQAYVVGVVDPEERTAAAAYTNTARRDAPRSALSSQLRSCRSHSARRT